MESSKPKRLSLNRPKHRLNNDSPKTPVNSKKSVANKTNESPSTPKSKYNHNLINSISECDISPTNDDYITASQSAMSNYRDVIWKWSDDSSTMTQSKTPIFKRKQRDLITLPHIEPKIDKTKGFYKFQKLLLGEGGNVTNLINSVNIETEQEENKSLSILKNQICSINSVTKPNESHLGFDGNSSLKENVNYENPNNEIIIISEDEDEDDLESRFKFNLGKDIQKTIITEKLDEDILNLLDDSECELLAECSQVVENDLKKILNPSSSGSEDDNQSVKRDKNESKINITKKISPISNTTNDIDKNLSDWPDITFDEAFNSDIKETEFKLDISSKKRLFDSNNQNTCTENKNSLFDNNLSDFSDLAFDEEFIIESELELKTPPSKNSLNNQITKNNLLQHKSQFSRHKSMPSPILINNKNIATSSKNFSRLPSSDCISVDSLSKTLTVKAISSSSLPCDKSRTALPSSNNFSNLSDEGKRKLIKDELERKKFEAQQRLRRKQLARQQQEAWASKNAQKFLQKKY